MVQEYIDSWLAINMQYIALAALYTSANISQHEGAERRLKIIFFMVFNFLYFLIWFFQVFFLMLLNQLNKGHILLWNGLTSGNG